MSSHKNRTVIHASGYISCMEGPRQLWTLCGYYLPKVAHAQRGEDVTCKLCRRSRAWNAMLASLALAARTDHPL